MQVWLIALSLFPALIVLHLLVSPHTKVEESFNIQAVHDILTFGIPSKNIQHAFKTHYDHVTFPGAVPRTFVGALMLAGISQPFIWLYGAIDRQQLGQPPTTSLCSLLASTAPHQQLISIPARGVLGVFNAGSLMIYAMGVRKAFGKATALWYIALQAGQFHVIYYASRTLPNMFAFGLSTLNCLFPILASHFFSS